MLEYVRIELNRHVVYSSYGSIAELAARLRRRKRCKKNIPITSSIGRYKWKYLIGNINIESMTPKYQTSFIFGSQYSAHFDKNSFIHISDIWGTIAVKVSKFI